MLILDLLSIATYLLQKQDEKVYQRYTEQDQLPGFLESTFELLWVLSKIILS
mgnify:CR=1 FL=1